MPTWQDAVARYAGTTIDLESGPLELDEEGVVTHAWYNVKATGHVAKIMRDLGLAAA